MHLNIHSQFQKNEQVLSRFIQNFTASGTLFGNGKRNTIKLFELEEITVNIKSFKVPNFYNKIIYKFFRKSKAKRSFEYANRLLKHGIGTPQPIAYAESFSFLGLNNSYYISEHLECDLTFRELVEIPDFPENEIILRQFTQFCYTLHQKGIEFLDHSPGNTLIKKTNDGKYEFFLVDLNRMNFLTEMSFEKRMKNLSHLTPKKDMVAIMSQEYSKLYKEETEDEIFQKMWSFTDDFQKNYHRKIRLKKKLKFWK